MATLRPLADCLLIQPEPPVEYTRYKNYTHLVIPDRLSHGPEDRPIWGKILQIGNGCRLGLKVGSRIVCGKWAGARITAEKDGVMIVREDEVLAVDE